MWNKAHNKCNAFESSWKQPFTHLPSQLCKKIVFHEIMKMVPKRLGTTAFYWMSSMCQTCDRHFMCGPSFINGKTEALRSQVTYPRLFSINTPCIASYWCYNELFLLEHLGERVAFYWNSSHYYKCKMLQKQNN